MNTNNAYSTVEVAAIAKTSLRKLQLWDEQGIVKPRHNGHARRYAWEDLLMVCMVAELRRKGVQLRRIQQAVPLLRRVIKYADSADYASRMNYFVISNSQMCAVGHIDEAANLIAAKPYGEPFAVLPVQSIFLRAAL